MQYLNVSYGIENLPKLDTGFIPFGVWRKAYLEGAERPFSIAVERETGKITVLHTFLRDESFAEANYRYAERTVKFLLWSVGGFRVYLTGDDAVIERIRKAYTPAGERAFDVQFMEDVYERPFEVLSVSGESFPEANESAVAAAFAAGAAHATHLFNGMPAFAHRAPGVIGAAFYQKATAELICDGLHIHPSAIRVAHQLFGKNLVVISDSLRCAGMPDGDYELGGQPIEMKNGKATLKGSDTLAGSSSNLLAEVKNLVSFGLRLEDAIYAVTAAPAKVARLDHIGVIEAGKQADFLLLTLDLELDCVYIDGKKTI